MPKYRVTLVETVTITRHKVFDAPTAVAAEELAQAELDAARLCRWTAGRSDADRSIERVTPVQEGP